MARGVGNFTQGQMEYFVRVGPNNVGYSHLRILNMARTVTRLDARYIPASAQTEAYARSVLNAASPGIPPDVVSERVRARMDREETLHKGGVEHTVVIGRQALTGTHVDEQQLAYLKTLVERNRPEMDVRIISREDNDVLPTPRGWPLRSPVANLVIIHSFDEQRTQYTEGNVVTAHLDDGATVVEGLLAAQLEYSARFIAATALRNSAALEAINAAMLQLSVGE